MNEFLEGMDQRILLGYCADSILNRKRRNTEIEGWFSEGMLDHLFYDVLLFIMEYSLSESGGCSLSEVSQFLAEDLRTYHVSLEADRIDQLAGYMVKDILQNGGSILAYPVFHHETGTWTEMTVRLIEDRISDENILLYRLSEQGYDYLLRTKEIDRQFEGWVSMLITRQQLERRNYKESYKQARQSLQILRKQQTAFEEFIRSVRRDLHSVENSAYSTMIVSFYESLEEEQKMTREIVSLIQEYRQEMSVQKDRLLDENDAKLEESLLYLRQMAEILETITNTENELLSHRYSVRRIYEEMLETSLLSSDSFRRYDYFETILKPSASLHDEQFAVFNVLKRPLLMPKTDKILNLGLLYAPQRSLDEEDLSSEVILSEEEEENYRLLEKQKRMELYCRSFETFIAYAESHEAFTVKEFVKWCDMEAERNDTDFLSDTKNFYLMFLDLYALGTIDFEHMDISDIHRDETAEEFDLPQIFNSIHMNPGKLNIRSMTLHAADTFDYYSLLQNEDNLEYGMNGLYVTTERKDAGS